MKISVFNTLPTPTTYRSGDFLLEYAKKGKFLIRFPLCMQMSKYCENNTRSTF